MGGWEGCRGRVWYPGLVPCPGRGLHDSKSQQEEGDGQQEEGEEPPKGLLGG